MSNAVQRFHSDLAVMPKQSVKNSLMGTGFVMNGRVTKGKVWIHHRVPSEEQTANAAAIAQQFSVSMPYEFEPWDGPVVARVLYQDRWLKKHSQRKRRVGWAWDDTQPDLDNLHKPLFDVLQLVGAFVNDARICLAFGAKVWTHADAVDVILTRAPDPSEFALSEILTGEAFLKGSPNEQATFDLRAH